MTEPAEMRRAAEDAWWVAFGASVRDARKARDLRQEDLAELVGFDDRATIARIEAGRWRINAYSAARLAQELALGIPGWSADPAAAVLARQLTQARCALMDVLRHLDGAHTAARDGLS